MRRTVLLVDPDPVTRYPLSCGSTRDGFAVLPANDALGTLRVVATADRVLDAIVVDMALADLQEVSSARGVQKIVVARLWAAHKGHHGGRPSVITDDMLHTVLRRSERGESIEEIRLDLIIPAGKRKGQNPSLASIYRALAEHEKTQVHPEAVDQAHVDFASYQANT